jgi:hypothetical protein
MRRFASISVLPRRRSRDSSESTDVVEDSDISGTEHALSDDWLAQHGEAVRVNSVGSSRRDTRRMRSPSYRIVEGESCDKRSTFDDPVNSAGLSVGAAARRPTATQLHGFAVKKS